MNMIFIPHKRFSILVLLISPLKLFEWSSSENALSKTTYLTGIPITSKIMFMEPLDSN